MKGCGELRWSRSSGAHSRDLGRKPDEPELLQRGDAVVEANFLDDFPVLQLEDGSAGKSHFAPRIRRQGSRQEVGECWSSVCSATFPSADHMIAVRDEIGGAPEIEIGERLAKISHERLDIFPTSARLMQRILKQHVRRGEFVDDSEIAALAPEFSKPATDDGLVVVLSRHVPLLHWIGPLQGSSDRRAGMWVVGRPPATRFPDRVNGRWVTKCG